MTPDLNPPELNPLRQEPLKYNTFLRNPTAPDILPYVSAPVEEGSATVFWPGVLSFVGHPKPIIGLDVRHMSRARMEQRPHKIAPLGMTHLCSTLMDALHLKQEEDDLIFGPNTTGAEQAMACLQLARHLRTFGPGMSIYALHGENRLNVVHFGIALPVRTPEIALTQMFGMAAGG